MTPTVVGGETSRGRRVERFPNTGLFRPANNSCLFAPVPTNRISWLRIGSMQLFGLWNWLADTFGRTGTSRSSERARPHVHLESLEDRLAPAVADVVLLEPMYHQFLGRAPDPLGQLMYSQ